MKVAIITDQHFGARNDSVTFINFFEKFYSETFFPKLKEQNIKTLLILGDTFDRRKYINFYSLKKCKEMFFDPLAEMGVEVYMLAGNHDTYYKNTNEVNSVDLLLREYDNITVIDKPQTIHLDYSNPGSDICMMPWICSDNYVESLEYMKNDKSQICMGHFEIQGFSMYRGMESHEGLDRSIFNKFDLVFSGHYHHKSSDGSIHYLGNPYELTWSDYNDPRGFHFFDTDTRELEFVRNPNSIFFKIKYDDMVENAVSVYSNMDLSEYKDTYVKVVVENKSNPYLFDLFINSLYKVNPSDVSIVDEMIDLTDNTEDDIVSEAEDTITILNKYVDNLQNESLDNLRLKKILRELYNDALNLESV
jgi:DNA repair exonuclease SbcCD nuclease subunit